MPVAANNLPLGKMYGTTTAPAVATLSFFRNVRLFIFPLIQNLKVQNSKNV
jgi:hypothetical protein